LDYQRPPRQSFEGGVIRLIFERSKTLALKALAKKTGSTPYMVLFTAFNILLHRLSGQKDIIIATSSSGRDHLGFEGIFGMCTNTLVMRNKTEGNEPFILFLDKVKKSCLQAFDNQDYPFELLIKNLNLQRDVSRNPLFDVFFVYEEADNRVVKIKDLTFTPYEYEKQACAFDLLLEVIEEAGQLYLNMEYCAGLFRKETVERFLRYYMSILEQITENPSALLSDINLSAQRDGATSQKISGSSGMMTGLPATNCLYYPHRQNRDGLFPLSHHQERLWFVDRFESGYLYESSPVYYNMPLVIHLTGTIDEAALEKSVNRIIERHEILRTKIITSDGQAFQTVTPQSLLKLSVEELPERKEPLTVGRSPFTVNCQRSCGGWSTVLNQDSGSVLYTLTLKDIRHPFLMDKEPLIRSTLFNFGKEEHLLVITMHHIIADPWSMQIVMREMVELYNSITTGVLPHLPEIGIQFADFAEWEKETSYDLLAYKLLDLRLKLNGKIQALELPTDRPRPAIHTYHDGMSFFGLSQELTGQLKNLAIQEGVTTYSLLLAAFQTLLHRYSGQENIVTGVPVARRDRKEIVDVIGPFANLLVIPSDFSDRPTFRDLLRRVERNVTDIFEYRDAPFDRLVLALDPKKDMSRTALFDVMFQLRDSLVPMPAMKGLQTRVMETNLGWGKYDLNLCMEYGPEGMSGIMVYNKDLFDDSTIERMNKHYQVLLDSIVKYPSLPVTELRLLTAEEEHQQIFEWNDTRAAYPANMTIHQLFEEQVENTPDSTAVVIGKEKMTYRELNRKANQLAHHLRKKGVVPDQLVCICMERSMDMIIAMLAILKAGGAYTPLDPSYPRARLQFMLEDTGAPLVVTHERIKEMLPVESASSPLTQCSASLVLVDADMYSISRESEDNPVNYNSPEHLAYIIYTSGSTGKPKGVLIEHRNVVRLMTNDKFQFDFTKNDIWTMSHSYCFDFSVWEMYGALLYGGKLVIVPKEIARDSEKFLALLKAENVTVLNQTPRSFYNLAGMEVSEDRGQTTETGNCHPSSGLSLRYVIFGGEALKPAMLKGFNEKYPEVKLINMYGITETTVHVTYKEITESEIRANVSNVGKPIPTLTAYIMDKGLKLLPIGVPGELLVGGDGVARGYLNRAELTREKFIANPYKDGERLYRSGDLAKMLPNGEIEYLGRIDQQVKIRGYRIELGEIENVLMMHPQIDQAAVIDREDAVGDRFLCAYLVVKNKTTVDRSPFTVHGQLPTLSWRLVNGLESSFSEEALRRYLGDKLPEYMIPSQFFRIENMPLTSNGKIDTKALLLVEGAELKHDTEFAGPQTAHEELLVSLWKAVLGREEIGVLDNYFTLGGDSIKAIQILSRLNQHHLKLEVRHIFETPTIRALAKKLETISRIPQQGIITGRVPLTAIQTWFFMEHGNDKELLNHYTQAVLLHSKNRVDDRALGLSLMKLQEHHDSLRMIFRFEGESVVQEIASLEYPLGFTVVDLKEREDAERELDRICAEVPASLQMTMGPMMKTVLFRLDDGDRILIVIHHLAVDGVSWRILIEDLEVCYGQAIVGRTLTLPQKTDSYRLWAEKIAQYSTSRKLLEEIPFWRQIEEIGALAIPPDYEAATVEGTSNPIVEGATSPIVEGASSSITVEGTRSPMTLLCRLNRYEDMGTVFVKLSHDETTDLITKANSAYHTEVNDLLLAAFGRAMKRCYGAKRGFIDVEGHGRELLFNDIAIGRTVGWFTSMYPALIDIPESEEPGSQIKQIKEGLRRIPNKGVGYGILKYLVPAAERSQMQSNSRARILFNYLGSFDAGEESRFFIDDKGAGNTISGRFERESEIVIEGAIIGNRLKLGLSYNTKVHCKETVDMFLGAYRDELLVVIGHCVSRETGELTPHDLTYNDLTVQELDNVLAECKISIANLKDIYPLSPLQEGILFHAMLLNGSNVKRLTQSRDLEVKNLTPPPIAYFMQISFGIEGELNLVFFEACWNMLIARHDILRTVFTHKGADRPLQVVARTGTIDFRFEDIIALSDDQQREHLAEFRNNDRKEGFNLMVKAPMRVSIFKKSARSFEVIWSYHHLLIDGWCAGILMSEFFETYGALRQGGAPAMTLAAPYGAYIRWVEHLDHQATIDYWRDYLDGYDHPAVLPKKQGAVDSSTLPSSGFRPESFVLEIGPQTVESLKRFASGNQVTVNTIIQTAWGLVLGRYSGADDVVFGATVSGRPAEVADIENMAGLFINTIPVRIRINPEKTVARLVRDVQADALKSQAHHYGSLADVQAATSLKQELLDHVMVFENYPLADELIGLEQKYSLGFCIKDVKVLEQTNYDLIIVVEPGRKMQVEFRYNAAVFPADMMEQVKDAFEAVISSMAGGADISIGQLRLSLMSKTEQNERDSFIKSAQEISEDF
ncbi:MAG: amino acid adenylation domain-containing protein, partial [Deltaproteobacteria bacterium]